VNNASDVPFNFSWIEIDRVAGMARPRPDDASWLIDQGITALLSLTTRTVTVDGLDVFSIPVQDMTAPTLDQLHLAVAVIGRIVSAGGAVAVHCAAGMGRTGTILAAYLIAKGLNASEAIARVRALRPGSIETIEQEQMLARYAELAGGSRA